MSQRIVLLSLLLTASAGCPPSCDAGQEAPTLSRRCDAPAMRDELGGVVVLRGASWSAEAKWSKDRLPPYSEADLERLQREFGMNAVRLLVFWEAIEPLPGVYDRAYLAALRRWVDSAGAIGLHVVVDMHQDVYGRGFGHSGAPYWSCPADRYATFEPQEPWFLGYLQREVGDCFDGLYGEGPIRAAFVAAWAKLAESLRGSDTDVTYELLNEPFWGSTSAAEFEAEVLVDLYRELIDVITHVDRDARFMIQPSPATNVGVPSELGDLDREHVVYAPHFYPPSVELGSGYHGREEELRQQLGVLCGDAERLDAALAVGEIGVRRNVTGVADYLHDLYDALDDAQASAFYWSYEQGGSSSYGMLESEGAPSLQGRMVARPYPRRVAGTPLRWKWDAESGVFSAEWLEEGDVGGDTRISLPSLAFPHGVTVNLERGGTYFLEGSVLHVPPIGGHRQLTVQRRPTIARGDGPGAPASPPKGANGIGPHGHDPHGPGDDRKGEDPRMIDHDQADGHEL